MDFSSHVYLCHQSHLPLWRWWTDLKKIMSLICTWVMCSWCCPRMVKCSFDLHYSRVSIWLLTLLNGIIERIFIKRNKLKMCFFSYQLWLNLYKNKMFLFKVKSTHLDNEYLLANPPLYIQSINTPNRKWRVSISVENAPK